MRAGPESDRAQHRFLPPVRLGMTIGVGKNARIPVMQGTGSREVTLRVGHRYLKRGVTDTGWFTSMNTNKVAGRRNSEARL